MSDLYEVDVLYERSHRMDTVCSVLFWANCALSVLAFWPNTVQRVIICMQMMTAIGHVVLGLVNDCALWFEAESANRKHLIEDAFGVDFTNRRSCGYYNNHFDQSAERFVTNAFESSFFTMSVSEAMILPCLAKTVLALLLFILILFLQPAGVSISDVTQAVFSAYLVEDAAFLFVFHGKIKAEYERFYEFLVGVGVVSRKQMILAMANAQEYECTKAYFKIRLDSGRFEAMNDELSKKWLDIERRVVFNVVDAEASGAVRSMTTVCHEVSDGQ